MNQPNLDITNTFTLETLPDLDTVVLAALELYQKEVPPQFTIKYKRPLVVGSGNAEVTGRIIFENTDAVFVSESSYEAKLMNIEAIDGVVLISASGAKHAPIITKHAKELGKHVTLITTTKDSEAHALLDLNGGDEEYVFPKNREPYTYNTSTYMGMIVGSTNEDIAKITSFIKSTIDSIDFTRLAHYEKYYLIVPSEFSLITRMLSIKFTELFGRVIAHGVETSEQVKHATTVVPSQELFISFGAENILWGEEGSRMTIPLPEDVGYGAMMAIGYYVIGKIQKAHPPYFKQHIKEYTEQASQVFNETISPIVE